MHVGPVHQRPRCGRSIQSLGPTGTDWAMQQRPWLYYSIAGVGAVVVGLLSSTLKARYGPTGYVVSSLLVFLAFALVGAYVQRRYSARGK
jgi:hypothetical protein